MPSRWLDIVRLRLKSLVQSRAVEGDLDEELQGHVDHATEEFIARGMSRREARRAALVQFGGLAQRKEECREARGLAWSAEVLWQDLRFGARMLLKTRGVAAAAIASLALGIGANTAVFSLIDAVLLKPLPYADADRLVMIWSVPVNQPGLHLRANAPEYLAWKDQAASFEAIGTEGQMARDLGADDGGRPAERVRLQRLTSSLFDVLGVRPALGRPFRPNEETVGVPAPVAILSDTLWLRRYNRDPSVINAVVRLDGKPTTIIGVMPRGFSYLSDGKIDIFVPFAFNVNQTQSVTGRGYAVAAKLKPGVTVAHAQAEMDAIVARLAAQFPERQKGWSARVEPLHDALYGDSSSILYLLEGVVGLVLLIACANVAGLLVARSTVRRTEIAIRAAIGAGRGRIVRQLLTESAMLALIGGAAGILVAKGLLRVLVTSQPLWPRQDLVAIDGAVLAFTVAISAVTGLLAGCVPAMRASRPQLVESLQAVTRGSPEGGGRQRLRSGLVVIQIALAFMLLIGAGLIVRTYGHLRANDLGVTIDGVLAFDVSFQGSRYQTPNLPQGWQVNPIVPQTLERIWEGLQRMPGVESAAGVNHAPFKGGASVSFTIEGQSPPLTPADQRRMSARYEIVTPDFFRTMGIALADGRVFGDADRPASPWTLVVNEAFAHLYFPSARPLGQRLQLGIEPEVPPREIVGVVADTRASPYDLTTSPAVYALFSQQPPLNHGVYADRADMTFVIRSASGAAALGPAIRRLMTGIDTDRPVMALHPLAEDLDAQLTGPRYAMTVFSLFALMAVALTAIGIYGVTAYAIGQRTREIGVRMALGASHADVLRLVMRHVVVLAAIGLAAGVGGALALSKIMRSLVDVGGASFVAPTDPLTFAVVSALMAAVAVAAGLIPTLRAIHVAPTVALRSE